MTLSEVSEAVSCVMPQFDKRTWHTILSSVWRVAIRQEQQRLSERLDVLESQLSDTGNGRAQRVAYERVRELIRGGTP